MIRQDFFPHQKSISLETIYELLKLDLPKGVTSEELAQTFTHLATLKESDFNSITLFHNGKYKHDAKITKAGVCFTTELLHHHVADTTHVIIHEAPYRAYAKIASYMYDTPRPKSMIHPTAVIDETASIGDHCHIGPYVVIGKDVKIGAHTTIESHTQICDSVCIGEYAHISSNVTLQFCVIGKHFYVKPGTRIGQQGFGFHMDDKGHFNVPQLGIVEIGNDVQIGANVCIDRGSLGNTIICDGARIDNLVQIGHNVHVGPMSVLVAQVGVAGSSHLGRFVILAGQVGVAGHINIGDYVKVAAQSGLMRDVEAGQTVAGSPAVPVKDWHKQTIILKNLVQECK